MPHKDYATLENELAAAKKQVKIGAIYSHYKNPKHLVKVMAIGIGEANEKLYVIYQDASNEKIVFVRDLDIWLQEPTKGTPRFKLVSPKAPL